MAQKLQVVIENWVAEARDKVAAGSLAGADLDCLVESVGGKLKQRQRLFYLHASSPSIYANLVGSALHEPETGWKSQIDPLEPELPYDSVHQAILDGWRVIHFPQQMAPYDDREIDVIGYEFVLEKMEVYTDG